MPLALSKKFDFEKIITHELKLSDGETAYEMFDKKLNGCIQMLSKLLNYFNICINNLL